MMVLAFVACMQGAPDMCEERNLTFADTMTPQQCMMRAQIQLAQWCETHPGWRIGQWRCGHPDHVGLDI